MAVSPALYIFLSALITLALVQASGYQVGYAQRLFILAANSGIFAAVSRVQAFQTKTVIEGMKIAAWGFSALVMYHFSLPATVPLLPIVDFLLKGAIVWIAWSAVVSIYPYSVVDDANRRDNIGVAILILFIAALAGWTVLTSLGILPTLPISRDLLS